MRYVTAVFVAWLVPAVSALAGTPVDSSFDWEPWRHVPVQDGGRYKPLDTLAWEALRTIANQTSLVDPQTRQRLRGVALYLTLLFEWQASGQVSDPHSSTPTDYFLGHTADKWDRAPLIRVDNLALRDALGLPQDQKYISPLELSTAKLQDPKSGRETPFLLWAKKLGHNEEAGLSAFDRKVLELANNFWAYREHRMGKRLEVLPIQGSEHEQWLPLADLLRPTFDDQTDPTGGLRKAQEQFRQARAAYLAGHVEAFHEASAAFIATLKEYGPQLGAYPNPKTIDLEVAYNGWAPFRFAWVLTALAFLGTLLSLGTRWKPFYAGSLAVAGAAVLAMLVGFGMRIGISGRAPVTNMYESVVYLGLGTAVFGLVFELIYRKHYVLTAAAAIATVALILADNCSAVLDPSMRPLPPVLRSNFWLVTHVMSITLSYAAFALALGIGDITLGYYLLRSANRAAIAALSKFTYKCLQVGVLLLAIGTILGAVWADYAWGRFWGWDPKEVWALITLLGYLAVLHARYIGWVRELGLAALSVICFSLVVMAWYGVNFWLGTGLHSYGFGSGGQMYVAGVLLVQFLYVLAAVLRAEKPQATSPADDLPSAAAAAPAATRHLLGRAEKVAS
jgi:cytochrome c-type biogenesis protein CcsB